MADPNHSTTGEPGTYNPEMREFIGRQTDMAQLEGALSAAEAGHGSFITLSGEPGIGKTRTAQELARRAQERGVQVLWGWCYEGEGAPSYWPLGRLSEDLRPTVGAGRSWYPDGRRSGCHPRDDSPGSGKAGRSRAGTGNGAGPGTVPPL